MGLWCLSACHVTQNRYSFVYIRLVSGPESLTAQQMGVVMGRHRNRRAVRTIRQISAAASVFALLGAGAVGYRWLSEPSCTGTVILSVTATAEIAPALTSEIEEWENTDAARVGDRCVEATVTAEDSADVASSIALTQNETLVGLSTPGSAPPIPDVWVPDSTLWVRRLASISEVAVPTSAPSIATSPVVLAASESVALNLGWPDVNVTWSDVFSKVAADATLHVGIVDPAQDAASLASLVTLTDPDDDEQTTTTGVSTEERAAVVSALRMLADGRSSTRDDLTSRFPDDLSFAPLSEQAIVSYNAANPQSRLVGISMLSNPCVLDYPYTVMPTTTGDKAEAASALRVALSTTDFRDKLDAAGLRDSDGTAGGSVSTAAVTSVDPSTQALVPDGETANHAVATWSALTASSRMLAILDVSGSMLEPVPTADGMTRMALTINAASQGLALFDDSWAVGLWTFSTNLDGNSDFRELAPIGSLMSRRDSLQQALAGITPKSTGDTGLYDTVLAAYQTVQSGWDSEKVNSVVLLTDGENDDPSGLSLEQLVTQLKSTVDPEKPIQVILMGIGTGTSESSMRQITDVTGGGVFIAEDPAKIGDIFLQAIALRSSGIVGD